MADEFQMSTGQAHELALAFGRNGWANLDVKKLSEGDLLARLLLVVRGKAEVKPFEQVLPAAAPAALAKLPHVPDGEVFELTLDGDAPENQPLQMVRSDGYGKVEKWWHNGHIVQGTQTRRFKWVAVGHCRNFDAVEKALAPHGKIPEGQWREAVKEKFQPDGVYPRGIARASWLNSRSSALFPYVDADGDSRFLQIDGAFLDYWRWLVEVSESA